MNLQTLQGIYQNDIHVKQMVAGLSVPTEPFRLSIENSKGSSFSFIFTAVWQAYDGNHVVIANDREEAAYLHNDIEHLSHALDICYFPDSYKRAGNFHELNSSHVMLRTEALTKFSHPQTRKKYWLPTPRPCLRKW